MTPTTTACRLALALIAVLLAASSASAQAPRTITTTIAAGASLSAAVDLGVCTPVGLIVGAQATPGWTDANITVQASQDGMTYYDVFDYGAEVTVTVPSTTANLRPVWVQIAPADLWGKYKVKFRSGTAATPVNQVAARTIKVPCR